MSKNDLKYCIVLGLVVGVSLWLALMIAAATKP